METNKYRHYLTSLTFIILGLICALSAAEQYNKNVFNRNILIIDFVVMAICFPAAIIFIVKARRSKPLHSEEESDGLDGDQADD